MRLAVMQPYFAPYAGYFRLLAGSDVFVLYDCVQFPRRSWVHRNRLRNRAGELEYLTLPLMKAPQDVRIDALQFAKEREPEWREDCARFPAFPRLHADYQSLTEEVLTLDGTPVDYLERLLKQCATLLDIPWNVTRSSTLNLPDTLRGEERILAICTHFGATDYLNSPGGRELYSAERFAREGVRLQFLSDWQHSYDSILQRLADEELGAIRAEIQAGLR